VSIFLGSSVACPACGTPVDFDVVASLNGGRRPDQRRSVLDGSFQRKPCPSCGTSFRLEPEFTYLDVGRGQYIGVWPISRRASWKECAERTQATFDNAFGSRADASARAAGAQLQPRVVFGWPALVEKLLAQEAGVDDRTLEAAKLVALRSLVESPLPGANEFRLVGLDGDALVVAWVHSADERLGQGLRVPRSVIDAIESDPAAWQAVREEVADGLVVDFQREMLAG